MGWDGGRGNVIRERFLYPLTVLSLGPTTVGYISLIEGEETIPFFVFITKVSLKCTHIKENLAFRRLHLITFFFFLFFPLKFLQYNRNSLVTRVS